MEKDMVLREVLYSPLELISPQADTIVKADKGWHQVFNPSVPEPDRNEIVICEQNPPNVLDFFEKKRDEYFEKKLPFKWCWNPFSKPDVLEPILSEQCSKSWEFSGMAIDPTKANISIPECVTLEEVDEGNLNDYLDCKIKGWNISGRDKIKEACLVQLRADEQKGFYFISYFQGTPAGVAGFTKYKNSCYLGGAVVLPEYRGKGLYKALLKGRLDKIAKIGISLATTQAREATSAPILASLGFQRVFTGKIYQFDI